MNELPAKSLPLVTVIVTTFNVAEFVEDCLTSVVGQTYSNLEILLVDDGSTDKTVEVATQILKNFPRHKIISLPRNTPGGVGTAANIGLDKARGKYVGFVDGDDLCRLDMFEKLVENAEKYGADLTICDYQLLDSSSGALSRGGDSGRFAMLAGEKSEVCHGWDDKVTILRLNSGPWRKLYSLEFLNRGGIRFPSVDIFWEDNPFHWFVTLEADSFALVDEALYVHRMGRVGATMSAPVDQLLRIFEHRTLIEGWLQEKGLLEEYKTELARWAISQFEWVSRTSGAIERYDEFRNVIYQSVSKLTPEELEQALEGKGEISETLRQFYAGSEYALKKRLEIVHQPSIPFLSTSNNSLSRAVDYLRVNGLAATLKRATKAIRQRSRKRRKSASGPHLITREEIILMMSASNVSTRRQIEEALKKMSTM